MSEAEQILIKQLAQKDATIEELRGEIEELEGRIGNLDRSLERLKNGDDWEWRHIRTLKSSHKKWSDEEPIDVNFGLPVPRLEIRWFRQDDYYRVADYGLVIEHLLGHIMFIPISSTRQGGSRDFAESPLGCVDTPFRDGAHIMHDMKALNLPAFSVNQEKRMWVPIIPGRQPTEHDIVYFKE